MGRGGIDDIEKDPSLFPERRVRPWVVDEESEAQMEEMLDNLEKTLNLTSPVNHGLGLGALDRNLRSDKRGGDLLYAELASLEARTDPASGRVVPELCRIQPIGEVFEALYRESHGLPPRNKPAVGSCESADERLVAEAEVAEATMQGEDTTPELTGVDEGGLAADGDVARLLDELQTEFDGDCSDSGGEVDDGEEYESAVGKENEQNQSDADGTSRGSGKEGKSLCSDDEQVAGNSPRSRHRDRGKQRTEYLVSRTGGGEPANRPPFPPEEGHTEEELLLLHGQRGRVDISRMKIDGPKRRTGIGPRPRSAPSACLSAGGFSRLSRTSSSHLTRAASQKLLQATKEAQEKESSEAQELGEALRRAPGSLVAQADNRIDVVKQKADELQASMSVRRTSYLRGHQPRPARFFPRDADAWRSRRRPWRGGSNNADTTPSPVRQRPQTATTRRRGPLKVLGRSTTGSTPLLSRPEAAFLFGAPKHGAGAQRQPSLRKTTLGHMLRRASPSETHSDVFRLKPKRCSTKCDRLSADPDPLCGGGDGCWCDSANHDRATKPTTGGNTSRTRPSSAAPAGRGRATTPANLSSKLEPPASVRSRKRDTCGQRNTPRGNTASQKRTDDILAANSSARNHAVAEATHVVGRPELGGSCGARRGDGPARNVNQALEAVMKAAIGAVSPREQFVNARQTIAEMKKINTKDSTGDILQSTQGMSRARVHEDCWSSEIRRQYR